MESRICFNLLSLPISVLRNLEIEANKFYNRANKFYKAALLTRCYVQYFLSPSIDSEVSHKWHFITKIVNEYDQEIPQSQTADNPVAPRGRAAQPSLDTRKTN